MNIKKVLKDDKEEIVIMNENNQTFKIFYGGADLYWILDSYTKDNNFVIKEEDGIFFEELKKLFYKINDYDDKYMPTLQENTFEWFSESYGQIETANKLVIKKDNNQFNIYFVQNQNGFIPKNTCYISFCLSGSRNQKIAYCFSTMFQNLCNQIQISHEKVKKR